MKGGVEKCTCLVDNFRGWQVAALNGAGFESLGFCVVIRVKNPSQHSHEGQVIKKLSKQLTRFFQVCVVDGFAVELFDLLENFVFFAFVDV